MSSEKRLSFAAKPVSVQKEKIIPNPLGESQTICVTEEMYELSFEETITERVKPDLSYFFDQDKKQSLESVTYQEYDAFPKNAEHRQDGSGQPNKTNEPDEMTLQRNLNKTIHEIKEVLAETVEKLPKDPAIRNVDAIIGDEYKEWNKIDPVLIDAPTGSGKTTFVYKKLIPDAISNGRGVLIVSNRIALSMQQKLAVYDTIKQSEYNSLLEGLEREDINKETYMIGSVCVTTYQGLDSLFNPDVRTELEVDFTSPKLYDAEKLRKWSRTIKYAVFDEIHLLYADAEFNGFCHRLLRYIPFVFQDVIRVYMTATSYEIKDYIKKYEIWKNAINMQDVPRAPFMDQQCKRYFNNKDYSKKPKTVSDIEFTCYTIELDYSRYNLKFFYPVRKENGSEQSKNSDDSKTRAAIDVLKQIEPSENNKVIVFVDNKEVGEKICSKLRDNEVTAAFLTKDISDPDTVREKIINNMCFDEAVLVTTQVLDSGVNIKDKSVKNIIIFYTDRTQFIQSLGRKRLEDDEGNLTVWAFVPSKKSFSIKMSMYMKYAEFATDIYYAFGHLEHRNGDFTAYAQNHLTNKHYKLLERSMRKCKCNRIDDIYIDSYYTRLFNVFVYDNNKHKTLCYMESRNLRTNIHVLGVILGKIEFLKQFVYPDDNGVIKDYREEVCEWLGKQNLLAEIKEKQKEEHKELSEALKNKLKDLLKENIGIEFSNRQFAKIHLEIVKTYEKVFPERVDSKRSNKTKSEMGAGSLNKWLEELGSDYTLKVKLKDAKGKNIDRRIWQIEKKTDIPQTPEV